MVSISLSLGDFKPIEFEDKKIFENHYEKYPPVHSDYLFSTMISWMEYGNYHYAFLGDNIIIMTKIRNRLQFRPPFGKFNKDIFKKVFQLAKKEASNPSITLIDSKTKELIQQSFPKFEFNKHRDYFEYVYLASDIAELSGSKYSKIRNRLNKFQRKYEYKIEDISKLNFNEIKEFLNRWCLWKDCDSDPILENEKKAILFSMKHFFDLGLKGISMRINENIEAIAVYEKINSDTAVVHYEKASPDFDGIYKAINQETAKILQQNFLYINRESDMGLAGLRKAKKSYRPNHMIEVYHLHKKNIIL